MPYCGFGRQVGRCLDSVYQLLVHLVAWSLVATHKQREEQSPRRSGWALPVR